MKNSLYIGIILFITNVLYAQPLQDMKRDHIWKSGYQGFYNTAGYGLNEMNFSTNPPTISMRFDSAGFSGANASICDSIGNLLFYTNNIFIYGADGIKLSGSDTLSPDFFSQPQQVDYGYTLFGVVTILPLPNSPNIYYVIHQRVQLFYSNHLIPSELYYSIVDMSAENGRGRVVSARNRLARNTTFSNGKVNACRHANGRDWWIVQWAADYSWYYTFLLTPEGIQDKGQHTINTPLPPCPGQAVFSPDGSKYAILAGEARVGTQRGRSRLDIYDFDRCNGSLNRRSVSLYITDTGIDADTFGRATLGVSTSPNSRYLYVTTNTEYFQYDLDATNTGAYRVLLAEYDGFIDPNFLVGGVTVACTHQLAPNGKIYISTGNGTQYLHTIESPDIGGIGCNVQQHNVRLPAFNTWSVPNHPNYRLGALAGSPCDTLTVGTSPPSRGKEHIRIFPNPTSGILNIAISENIKGNLYLYNALGQTISVIPIFNNLQINTYAIPNGIYFLSVVDANARLVGRERVVVQHE